MLKSMTGYGKGEAAVGGGRIIVEIRSVNHRYSEITVKLPRTLLPFELEVKKGVAACLKRGKVDIFIQREELAGVGAAPVVNVPLAKAYAELFSRLKTELGLAGEVSLEMIAGQRDVLVVGEASQPDEALQVNLMAAVQDAIENLDSMRSREGAALLQDMRQRRELADALLALVEKRAPAVVADYAARLRERVAQLIGAGGVDEMRLAQEVAIMADRCDVTEELVRFRSHLGQLDQILTLTEPVGRKLDFLLQEMNREVNTIGSKANDAAIAGYVVELKAELEKIREQVQNIE